MPNFQPRRSALYVPGSRERAVEKARALGADVVIFDLEDAVAPTEKVFARSRIAALVAGRQPGARRPEIVVRVNGLDTPWGLDDLAAMAEAGPDALLLPKVSRTGDIDAVRAALPAGVRLPLWAMIETPLAVLDPLAIARSQDVRLPLVALVLGLNDLARETRTRWVPGRAPMLPWMMNVLAAARAGGLDILDGVYNDLADAEGFAAECVAARDCGFDGKTLIHPTQIDACNRVFSPTADEIASATRIVEAFERPENAWRGAIRVDGRMVERLHAEMAGRVLALARALPPNPA